MLSQPCSIPNIQDDRRWRKIRSLRRKAIHALRKKRSNRPKTDFHLLAVISIKDVCDAEEELTDTAFQDHLAADCLLPYKHNDYPHDDECRFLKARKFDSKKVVQMWAEKLRWTRFL